VNESYLMSSIARELLDFATSNLNPITLKVGRVQGNLLIVDTADITYPGPLSNYTGGVIEFMSGNAEGVTVAVVSMSSGGTITTDCSFVNKLKPSPGDTIKLSMGKLKGARVYLREPQSVEGNDSYYLVTVNPLARETTPATIGAGADKTLRWKSLSKTFRFEVVIEAPNGTYVESDMDGTVAQQSRANLADLEALSDQVNVVLLNYRFDGVNQIKESTPLSTEYLVVQRTGSNYVRNAAIITSEFTIR